MAAELGDNVLIKIDDNNTGGGAATWKTIGQQRDSSLGKTSNSVDVSDKNTFPWRKTIVADIGWTVSCEAILADDDVALVFVRTKWEAAALIWVQIDKSSLTNGLKKEGQANVLDISETHPKSDVVKVTFELEGYNTIVTSP